MKNGQKMIVTVYILLTILAFIFVGVTTIGFGDVIPAVVLLWMSYFWFYLSYKSAEKGRTVSREQEVRKNNFDFFLEKHKMFVLVIALICSLSITKFYTGQSVVSVFRNLLSGESLYLQYQQHHAVNNIGVFSLTKIPYILMNATLNFITFYSILFFIKVKEDTTRFDYLYVIMVSLVFWFFGLARGTNFEIFELCVAIIYSIFTRKSKRRKLKLKTKVLVAVLMLVACIIFSWMYTSRGSSGKYITSEILYNEREILPSIFPQMSLLIARLGQYFSFGFFYTSATINKYLLQNIQLIFGSLFPGGLHLMGCSDLISETNKLIDAGTNWRPDIVNFMGDWGILGIFAVYGLLGYVIRRLELSSKTSMFYQLLSFYLLLQMFSFPIANFIVISSANKIVLFFACFVSLKESLNIKIKFK